MESPWQDRLKIRKVDLNEKYKEKISHSKLNENINKSSLKKIERKILFLTEIFNGKKILTEKKST
jgi:hypothetical protein